MLFSLLQLEKQYFALSLREMMHYLCFNLSDCRAFRSAENNRVMKNTTALIAWESRRSSHSRCFRDVISNVTGRYRRIRDVGKSAATREGKRPSPGYSRIICVTLTSCDKHAQWCKLILLRPRRDSDYNTEISRFRVLYLPMWEEDRSRIIGRSKFSWYVQCTHNTVCVRGIHFTICRIYIARR